MRTDNRQRMSNARLAVVQALYLYDLGDNKAEDIMLSFIKGDLGTQLIDEDPDTGEEEYIKISKIDEQLFKKLFRYAVDNKEEIDEIISSSLTKEWPEDRLEMVLRAILRSGISELYKRRDVDSPIIICEYVDIASSFYNQGPESRLVNAVLDKISKLIKPQFIDNKQACEI